MTETDARVQLHVGTLDQGGIERRVYVAWFRVKEPLPEAMPQAAQISKLSEAHA